MPRKSIQSLVFEVSMIVVTIGVVGHLTVNFWERYFVNSELAQMKESLHALKNTLFKIGNAYDALHRDLKGLAELSAKKSLLRADLEHKKFINTLDRRRLHDIEVNAMIDAKYAYTKPLEEKNVGFDFFSITRNKVPFLVTPKNDNKANIIKETNIKESIDYYPFKKNEADNIVINANHNTATKATGKVKMNMTTMTRNPPRSVGAGSFSAYVDDNCKHR